MPFDVTTETPGLRRARLIEALRNDTKWQWNFCNTAACAVGMARTIWKQEEHLLHLVDLLGLTTQQYGDIFGFINPSENELRAKSAEWSDFYGMERPFVTPAMVADALETLG